MTLFESVEPGRVTIESSDIALRRLSGLASLISGEAQAPHNRLPSKQVLKPSDRRVFVQGSGTRVGL